MTEGDGDPHSLQHPFDESSSLILLSDRDYLRARLPENPGDLVGSRHFPER